MKDNDIRHQLIDDELILEYKNVGELFLKKVNEHPNKKFIIVHADIKEEFVSQ